RLGLSLLVGLIVGVVILLVGSAKYAPAVGWDVAASILLVWTWLTIWPMDAKEAAAHATREDPTRAVSEVLLLSAAVASLVAVGFFLLQARSAKPPTEYI